MPTPPPDPVKRLEQKYEIVWAEDGQSFTLKCKKCGGDVMAKTVAHPIWDGPFPCSGSGRCEYEQVRYCPNCEKEPNFHGTPIKKSPFEDLF